MTLADAVLAALPGFRAEAEALMLDAGSARRPNGTTYTGGAEVPAYTSLFSSPPSGTASGTNPGCKIQSGGLQARDEEVGGRTSTVASLVLHLPVATAELTVGDEWVVGTPHALSTVPTGAVYRVVGLAEGSQKTARRYQVERRPT